MSLKVRGPQSPGTRGTRSFNKTILDFDGDDSYVEEEDETYIESVDVSDDNGEDYDRTEDEELGKVTYNNGNKDMDDIEPSIDDTKNDSDTPIENVYAFMIRHEIPRKLLHSTFGFVTLYFYAIGMKVHQVVIPFTTLFVVLLANDIIRLHNPELNKKIVSFMLFIVRDNEVNTYNGVLYYVAGLIFICVFFPKDVVVISALLLSWADTAASTIGRKYGKHTWKLRPGKSVAGSLASFAVGGLSCYLFYGYFVHNYSHVDDAGDIIWSPETSKMSLHVLALATGIIASISEFIDIWGLDDNFTIPAISGLSLYWLIKLLHV